MTDIIKEILISVNEFPDTTYERLKKNVIQKVV